MGPAKNIVVTIFFLVLVLSVDIVAAAAPVTVQSGADGIIALEAEKYSRNKARSDRWVAFKLTNASGRRAVLAKTSKKRVFSGSQAAKSSPRLDYSVKFSKAGKHYIWLRGQGKNKSSNSVHIGLNGRISKSTTEIILPSKLGWARLSARGGSVKINVKKAGTYTLNLWMNETGAVVDKIIITSNSRYKPKGSGPSAGAQNVASGSKGTTSSSKSSKKTNQGKSSSSSASSATSKTSSLPGSSQGSNVKTKSGVSVKVFPRANARDVVVNDAIYVNFNSNTSNIISNKFIVSAKGGNIAGRAVVKGKKLIFTPSIPLEYNKQYTASINAWAKVNGGSSVKVVYNWKFTTINPKARHIVFFEDFNDNAIGTFTSRDLRSDWGAYSGAGVDKGRVSVVRDGSFGDKAMRIRYEARKAGLGPGGAHWKTRISSKEELYVSYWVKFKKGFNFVKGGKLPGLAGGAANTGKVKPTGRDGWSGRMMWRPNGKVVQYMYIPDQNNKSGKDFPWSKKGTKYFKPGQWYKVETRIKMNTPKQRNGIVQSWLNGELVLDDRKVRFRDISSLKIDTLLFTTFFGGSDSSWATKKAEYVYFDNVIISTRPITH